MTYRAGFKNRQRGRQNPRGKAPRPDRVPSSRVGYVRRRGGGALVLEWLDELSGQRGGHGFRDSISRRPNLRQVMGAKKAIDPWQHGCVVAIALQPIGVVPMVESWRGDDPFQRTEPPPQVRMHEISPDNSRE